MNQPAPASNPEPNRRTLLKSLAATLTLPLTASLKAETHPTPVPTYKNPLRLDIADPYVLRLPGRYIVYGSGGGENGAPTAYPAFTSTNLVDWSPLGDTLHRNPADSWSIGDFWAPEVYARNGRFYMVYSAQWRHNPGGEAENFRIGVAVADSATGAFHDLRNQPLFDPGYPIIDADVLFTPDGRAFLYYSRCCYKHPVPSEIADWARAKGWFPEIEESWIYGVELKPDFTGVLGEPVVLLRPPVSFADPGADWENRSILAKAVNRRWTEGPTAFLHAGRVYLMYSANYYAGPDYALGYATAEHPLGPFTKAPNNPVLQRNTALGGDITSTGHNCVTLSPDGNTLFCLYAGRTPRTGKERVMFLDRITITKTGILTIPAPDDTNPLPMPT